MKKALFINEADLCEKFVADLPAGWTTYAETAGFDLLLVRDDGVQIGVEAKMSLNAKVILQALDNSDYYSTGSGPDFRAVLVPYGTDGADMRKIANKFGLTVLVMHTESTIAEAGQYHRHTGQKRTCKHDPALPAITDPDFHWRAIWVDHMPVKRCKLPEYIPDNGGGHSGPMQLSEWKIKAIKIMILLEVNGSVTWRDFKELQINKPRWIVMGWLQNSAPGVMVAGARPLDLKAQHPVNYEQIKADLEKWRPKTEGLPI